MDERPTAHFRLNFIFRRDERARCTLSHYTRHLSEGMRGPLHTRYTSSVRRDEGPTADWLNLILRMDEGLVAHWVNLIFQGQLGMRGPLHTG